MLYDLINKNFCLSPGMVGATDVVNPSDKVEDQSPHLNGNPVFTISGKFSIHFTIVCVTRMSLQQPVSSKRNKTLTTFLYLRFFSYL